MGLLIAIVAWVWPVLAHEELTNNTQQPYIVAYNAPHPYESEPKEYIISQIISQSKKSGISPEILLAIAKCESGYQQKWNSRHWERPGYYTAFGVFQVIAGHEKTYDFDRLTLYGNIQIAIQLYLKNGLKDWSQSLSCIRSML